MNDSFVSTCKDVKFCFWDKHTFEGTGIMCPIFYKPRQIVRKKKEYYINQNISRNAIVLNNDPSFEINRIINEEIFYDDMFCSANCCLAWIEDNNLNPKYKNSKQIFFSEFIRKKKELPAKANHWRTIDKFGGFLTIESFRNFNKVFLKTDSKFTNNILELIFLEIINYIK